MPRVRADAAAAPCLRPRGLLHDDAEPVVLILGSERGVLQVSAPITFHQHLDRVAQDHRQLTSRNAPYPCSSYSIRLYTLGCSSSDGELYYCVYRMCKVVCALVTYLGYGEIDHRDRRGLYWNLDILRACPCVIV